MKHKNFDSVHPYGYLLIRISDNTKYVGIRYANVKKNLTPNQDFGKVYFTSGKLRKEFKKNPENFKFTLKHTFDSIDDAFEWERKVTLRVYKRKDWANQGWASNYKDNPEIGKLISEGKYKVGSDGFTSIERGAETLKAWIWNTEEGAEWREYFSSLQKDRWAEMSDETKSKIMSKRAANMDFKTAREKASVTLSRVGEDGLTGNQRNGRRAAETRKKNGSDSISGKKRDAKYNQKLGEMSEEEFEKFCENKPLCVVNAAKTRRKRYLEQQIKQE